MDTSGVAEAVVDDCGFPRWGLRSVAMFPRVKMKEKVSARRPRTAFALLGGRDHKVQPTLVKFAVNEKGSVRFVKFIHGAFHVAIH
jgi:hypothetical protein